MFSGLEHLWQNVLDFAFFYPLVMAYVWMTGALLYYFRYECRRADYRQPPVLPEYPLVSILVPCYNEAAHAETTLRALADLHYPNFEVLAVNDGSTDRTGDILNDLARQLPRLRVVHLAANQGKALALKSGALAARGEFLVCIDGDALLDHYAVTWIMEHFLRNPRVGAVTGNPRIRTRSTLLGRIQVGEFSAIVGLLKRAQRVYGRVFTVSGVICAFRRRALHQVGYWREDTLTEDIDISWRLQLRHWDVRFEPRALCWVLMPETLVGLFRQRLRWAVGGAEALKRYFRPLWRWKSRRMWGIGAEYLFSLVWSYAMLAMLAAGLLDFVSGHPAVPRLSPRWPALMLGLTCLLQFAVSLFIDRRYDHGSWKSWFSLIWYPLFIGT
jgi:biofilm PGA synthesis N-glycosyltransferase PgaC